MLNLNTVALLFSRMAIHTILGLQRGSPVAITKFPSPDSVEGYSSFKPNPAV